MNLKDRSKRISALINNPYGRSIAASNESELGLPGGSQDAMTASKEIDLWLLEGKKELDRRRNGVKILLLGQSESGKSAVLKNFQLAFASKHFERDRPAWKIVVHLNVIGSIKTILDALSEEYQLDAHPATPPDTNTNSPLRTLRKLQLSLSPLFFIESDLLKLLAPGCADCRRMSVPTSTSWKMILEKKVGLSFSSRVLVDEDEGIPLGRRGSQSRVSANMVHDPTSVLVAQRDDIIALWRNPDFQRILQRRRPSLKGSSGFFMDDIERITTLNYMPTDSDIIRARIKTLGAEEHYFKLESTERPSSEFYITDIGGSRCQRAMWAPFFDDVQCILFLAPLSFNEFLEEDPKVNRLEDSLHLWRDLCANKLLANVQIILFLNKRDVLHTTLKSGVQVKKYVPTYGNRPNEVTSVTQYFKEEFKYHHRKASRHARPFMSHETSAIDIVSMRVLLAGVQDAILRKYLTAQELI